MEDTIVKQAYIKEFGEEEYIKNMTQQFTDVSWPTPLLKRFQLYLGLFQLMQIMMTLAIRNKGRAVHALPATVGTGLFVLDDEARRELELGVGIPTVQEVRLRHNFGNNNGHPLAKLVKSCSVAIGDWLHVTALSSTVAGFWNIPSFFAFVAAQETRSAERITESRLLLKKYPLMWQIYKAIPYKNTSYLQLIYHSLMTYDLDLPSGRQALLRFRIRPKGLTKQKCMPKEEVERFWAGDFFDYEDRHQRRDLYEQDYKQEFDKRGRHVDYVLEYQIRDRLEHELWMARNCSIPWCEKEYPFRALGQIRITTLGQDSINGPPFDLSRLFQGLYLAEPSSIHDTASIGWVRSRVYNAVQSMRSWCFSV